MQRRTAGIIEVPIEADAIGLFLSEAEPGAPRGRRSTAKSAPSGTIFEVVPVGEATTRTSEWEPAPSAVGGHQPARAGRIRRGVLRVGRGIVFLICLPFRAVASVCAAIAAAIRALARGIWRLVTSVGNAVIAAGRALRDVARLGLACIVAVLYLPVRAWAFVATQLRLGSTRVRAWMLRTRTMLTTAIVNCVSSCQASLAARRHAFQMAVRAGWARAVAVAYLPVRAWAFVTAQMRLSVARVRAVSRGLVDVVAAGNFAAWRSIEATGRSLQDSGHLLTQALQSSRVRLLVPVGAGVEQVRNRVTRGRSYVRRAGPALSGDAGPAWLLMASTITFFAIASWQQVHQPERSVAPVAAAVPQAKTLVEAVAAIEADPPTVAPALAALSPRPAATLPKPRPVVAKTASPAAAPRVTRTTAATAAGLDALSVPMIWGGVDVRTLQDRLSALARQDVASSRCEVSRSSSTRAKAVCTGLLNSAPQPGNEAKQPRTRSWTIDLLQAEDRWQIVKVAAR